MIDLAAAARAPGSIAIVSGAELVSYGELDARVHRLAAALARAGVRPEVRVGVLLERSWRVPVALLAVLRAGGVYVPLDLDHPDHRLRALCRDARLGAIVVEHAPYARRSGSRSEPPLAAPDCPVIDVDAALDTGRDAGAAALVPADPDHLAYVIHTSGSTGAPKGVMVSRSSLAHHLRAAIEHYALRPGDRVLQLAAIGFDVALEEILPTLCAGATLVLAPPERWASFDAFSTWIDRHAVNVLNLPASWWHAWVAELARGAAPLPDCVRLVVVGSEAVHQAAYTAWTAHVRPGVQWRNGYGPTEATITATLFDPASSAAGTAAVAPIGRPLAGRTAHVLDDGLAAVAPGVPGTLYLGGAGLARGYLDQPALTAERFVPDPFGAPGARMYDTGDRVTARPDGTLEFLGRRDRQVKVRGHRVEPEELERVLATHPDVAEVAVTTRPSSGGELALIAYAVSRGPRLDPAALCAYAAARLPAHLVPAALCELPALPRGPHGKLDRSALPEVAAEDPERPYVAPRTETERIVVEIFAEVLGVAVVGMADRFLELGGHSLAAMRVAGRVRERLLVDLPLRLVFAAQTPEELAREIDAVPRAAAASATRPAAPRRRPERIPLSPPQEQVWLMHQLDPHGVAYTAPTVLRFDGAFDLDAMQRSVDELVRRHEILRTTFPAIDGRPVQRIHPPAPLPIELADLSALPEAERTAAADHRIAVELRRPFTIDELPLLRFHVIRLRTDHHLMVVVEHHLVHDGWSTNVLFGELFALYAAFARGLPSPLAPPALQFADFVLWHRGWLDGGGGERQLRYWTDKLAGGPTHIALPTDRAAGAPSGADQARFRGSALRRQLPPALCARLHERCRLEGVTPYVMLLAGYVTVLHRHARQRDLMIGTGIANRRWPEVEGMLGMIINTVVLRAQVAPRATFRDLLYQLRALTCEAADHQDLPFERIVEALQPERVPERNPIFQVIFGLHDAPFAPVELPGLAWSILESPSNGSAKFDLGLIVIPRPEPAEAHTGWRPALGTDGFTLIWEFRTDRFAPETIEHMHHQLCAALDAALADPAQPVSRLTLTSSAERARQLAAWNATATAYPRDRRIDELFAACAAASPAARAVSDDAGTLSYGELDERASRVAHLLRARGVRPRDVVALCSARSTDMAVALLGILKAGAAYLPLDPAYPAERLALMISDCAASVVVATTDPTAFALPAGLTIVELDRAVELANQPAVAPPCPTGADDVAYIMYTSGSTGQPKGVAVPHRAVVRLVQNTNHVTVEPSQRMLQISPLTFDASTIEIWGALLNGAELVVVQTDTVLAPGGLHAVIRARGLTTMFITTSLFDQLIDDRPDTFAPVSDLMIGGEAMSIAPVRRALAHGPPRRLLNAYGPTEATGLSAWHLVDAVPDDAARIPIGGALANTTLYVLDSDLMPVPVGVPGELYIGGDGLADGYVRRPTLTAERFIPDPFSGRPGARMYATGDVVRTRADGAIEFLGRADDQVKIRGHRIEPGEVQAVLAQHPEVGGAIALVRERSSGDKELIAFATGRPGAPAPSPDALQSWLGNRLPSYMRPAAIAVLDEFPVNAHGKVDRGALAARPIEPAPHGEPTDALATTPTQAAIVQIWRELLEIQAVGLEDDFFGCGGNSLQVMQLIARVQQQLGVALAVHHVFGAPTVAAMADAVDRAVAEAERARLLALVGSLEELSDDDAHRLLDKS
jgi:amino acid adenylation domain-containing protein